MTMVGGFDVHRKQITFDYVDTDTGLVRCGEIRPATRKTLRGWLGERCPAGDAEFAVEGCTGWRYAPITQTVTRLLCRYHLVANHARGPLN